MIKSVKKDLIVYEKEKRRMINTKNIFFFYSLREPKKKRDMICSPHGVKYLYCLLGHSSAFSF